MSRRRFELTDHEWSVIGSLRPTNTRGVPCVDDRRVINGILWRFRTGSPWADIPPKVNRKKVFSFSKWVYRQRNLVERFFAKIKQYRGIATRYDKDPANFLVTIKLAATRLWIKSYESAT